MFDPFGGVLSKMARRRLLAGWQGVFRAVVLTLLPVKELSQHFSADLGCPTKELYSMAGLVFLADFFGWTATEAAAAYMMRAEVQFALNIEPGVECCDRTVERYRKLFTDDDLASRIFRELTITLADLLELDVAKQRLDSTHVFSHMAADTAYGSDQNHVLAESLGVELISPVPGRTPQVAAGALTLDDFAHHEVTGSVEACPASHSPLHVTRDETTQTTVVEMSAASCASCPLLQLCPIVCGPDGRFELEFTDQARRTSARRVEAETSVFRERYAERSGIESTNSGLKNRLDMGWLPVRGRAAVFRTILLKVSGWNVLRASASGKLRAMVQAAVAKLLGAGWAWPFGQARVVRYSPAIRSTRPQMVQKHFRLTSPRTATIFRFLTPLTA